MLTSGCCSRTRSGTTCRCTTGSCGCRTRVRGSRRGGWSTRTQSLGSRCGGARPRWRRQSLKREEGGLRKRWGHHHSANLRLRPKYWGLFSCHISISRWRNNPFKQSTAYIWYSTVKKYSFTAKIFDIHGLFHPVSISTPCSSDLLFRCLGN